MSETLYIITPIFNPRKFASRIKLYHQFAKYVESFGAKLITVEVAFRDRPFEVTVPHNQYHLQLRNNHELWHKERAINLGIEHLRKLHPDVKKVAWIDADVAFTNPNWITDTLDALEHYDVVQMFSQATSLGPNHEILWSHESAFKYWRSRKPLTVFGDTPLTELSGGHPGLAWAARIDALDKLGGLMDFCIHGSGDSHMANALRGDVHAYYLYKTAVCSPSPGFNTAMEEWAAKCDQHIRRNVGVIAGTCNHYWHGNYDNRGYNVRWDIICHHQFDPVTDIKVSDNGLYEFTGNKPDFEQDLRLSMIARNDDENTIVPNGKDLLRIGDKVGGLTVRRVTDGYLKANPQLTDLKVGDLWLM